MATYKRHIYFIAVAITLLGIAALLRLPNVLSADVDIIQATPDKHLFIAAFASITILDRNAITEI